MIGSFKYAWFLNNLLTNGGIPGENIPSGTLLGQQLLGINAYDHSGWSVCVANGGYVVAVGAPDGETGTGVSRGNVRIYRYNGTTWLVNGNLYGPADYDSFGTSISLNDAGDRIIIGAQYGNGGGSARGYASIYDYNYSTNTWGLINHLNGLINFERMGYSVSMNGLGDWVAVGSNSDGTLTGVVRIYNRTDQWRLSATLNGLSAGDGFGHKVSINSAGNRIAVYSGSGDPNRRHVQIYERGSGNIWSNIGDIYGNASSLALNDAGSRLAIGDWIGMVLGRPRNVGKTSIYEYNGSTNWNLLTSIYGDNNNENLGASVSFNKDSNKIAIGSPGGGAPGATKIYEYDNTNWNKIAQINYVSGGEQSGYSLSLNKVGNRIAIGAPFHSTGGSSEIGITRVYSLSNQNTIQPYSSYNFIKEQVGVAIADNFGTSVAISTGGDIWCYGAPNFNSGSLVDAGLIGIFRGNTPFASIVGTAAANSIGRTISMNASGDRIVTSRRTDTTRVYRHNGASYTQLGNDIINSLSEPSHYSMDGIGNRFAVGYQREPVNGNTNSGTVRVYELISNVWTQIGNTFQGLSGSYLGACSLNKAGNILAIGARYTNLPSSLKGSVSTFEWNGSSWNLKGNPIFGVEGELFGRSIALNYEGNRLAICAPGRTNSPTGSGQVLVYDWSGTDWVQLGEAIKKPTDQNRIGFSNVSMNGAGDLLIIGDNMQIVEGKGWAGAAYIYQWYDNKWVNYVPPIFPRGADNLGSAVAMDGIGSRIVIGSPDYTSTQNYQGRAVYYSLSS